jgi:hypothetical protein
VLKLRVKYWKIFYLNVAYQEFSLNIYVLRELQNEFKWTWLISAFPVTKSL